MTSLRYSSCSMPPQSNSHSHSRSHSHSASSHSRQSHHQQADYQRISETVTTNKVERVDSRRNRTSRSTDNISPEPDPFTPNGIISTVSPVTFRRSNIGRRRANAISLLSSPARRGHSEEMAKLFQQAKDTVRFQDEARKRSCDENANKENSGPKLPDPRPFPRLEDDIPAEWRVQRITGRISPTKNNDNNRSGLSRNVELPLPISMYNGEESDVGGWTGDEEFLPKRFPGLTPIRPLFSGSVSSPVEDWLRQVDLNLSPPSSPRHQIQDSQTRHKESGSLKPAPLQIRSRSEDDKVDRLGPQLSQAQSDKPKLSIRRRLQRRKANRTTSGRIVVGSERRLCPSNDSQYYSSSSDGSFKSTQSQAEETKKLGPLTQSGIFSKKAFSKTKRPLPNDITLKANHDKPLPLPPIEFGQQLQAEKRFDPLVKSKRELTRWKAAPNPLTVKRLRPTTIQKAVVAVCSEPDKNQLGPEVEMPPPRLPDIEISDTLSLGMSTPKS